MQIVCANPIFWEIREKKHSNDLSPAEFAHNMLSVNLIGKLPLLMQFFVSKNGQSKTLMLSAKNPLQSANPESLLFVLHKMCLYVLAEMR